MVLECGEQRNLSQWSPEWACVINMSTAMLQTLTSDPWENSKAPLSMELRLRGMAKLSPGTCANVDSAAENVHHSGYLQLKTASLQMLLLLRLSKPFSLFSCVYMIA